MAFLQAPGGIQLQIQEACTKMSRESGKALKDLASTIKSMTKPTPINVNPHIVNSNTTAKALELLLKTSCSENFALWEVMLTAIVAVQLVEVITCVEKIAESVHELASLARFKDADPGEEEPADGQPHHIITINGSSAVLPEECGTVIHVTNANI